jgi:hypothetical protein
MRFARALTTFQAFRKPVLIIWMNRQHCSGSDRYRFHAKYSAGGGVPRHKARQHVELPRANASSGKSIREELWRTDGRDRI